MQFQVATDEMNYGLGMVTRAIAVRPIKQIYEGALIETPDDGLMLTCTDGEMTIKTHVDATISEDGCAILPAKLLNEIMRRQSAGDVDVKIDRNMRATIKSRGSNTNLMGMTAEDFPEINDVEGINVVTLPCARLRDAISKIMFAVSTDESRKILTGVLIETFQNETRLVGLDGFRLALQRIEAENALPEGKSCVSAVIPGRVMNEISKMLPDDANKSATITYNASHVMISFDKVRVYTTLLTGEFIDYKRILPDKWTTEIIVQRTLFGEAIERCGLMAREGKNNLIYLELQPEHMAMTAAAERGDVHEDLEIGFNGEPMRIAFNARYLTDVIRNIDSQTIRMCFNSSVAPCLIKPVEGEDYTFLVLPVRTFNNK